MLTAKAKRDWVVALVVGGLILVLGVPAIATPARPWAQPDGSANGFDYSGGGDDNGLFGDPQVVGNSFVFLPDFRAESGGDQNVNDRLEVEIQVHAGFEITGVVIQELGDYQITGTGEVSVSGLLRLTDLENFDPFPPIPRIDESLLGATPASPIAGTDIAGSWLASATADLTAETPPWEHFMIVLTNEVAAVADAGASSWMEKAPQSGAIVITVIPEPASAVMLVLGIAILRARRRR